MHIPCISPTYQTTTLKYTSGLLLLLYLNASWLRICNVEQFLLDRIVNYLKNVCWTYKQIIWRGDRFTYKMQFI